MNAVCVVLDTYKWTSLISSPPPPPPPNRDRCSPEHHQPTTTTKGRHGSLFLTPNISVCLQPASSKSVCVCLCTCMCALVCVCECVCACMRACMSAHRYVRIYMGVGWGGVLCSMTNLHLLILRVLMSAVLAQLQNIRV